MTLDIDLPFVSVIIPTYHDWDRLQLCIDAINDQTYPKNRFEIIVVNNDPEDYPFLKISNKNLKLLNESKQGSYAARNKAIKEAKGDVLAFTDSDCIPRFDWIENSVKALKNGNERVAGHVELTFRSKKLTWAEIYDKYYAFPQKKYASLGQSVTANLITSKRLFEKVGLFNDEFLSGGDTEWSKRAQKSGFSIDFCKDVVVYHPARYRLKELARKKRRTFGGRIKLNNWKSKRFIIKLILRGYLPPFIGLYKLFKRKDIEMNHKLVLFIVHYYLKIYSTTHKLVLIFGITKPIRS